MMLLKQKNRLLSVAGLVAVTMAGVLALGASADSGASSDSGRTGPPGSGGDEMDETIGGHPLTFGGPSGPAPNADAASRVSTPILHIEGPTADVYAAVAAVDGVGEVLGSMSSPGILRVEFHGDLSIAFHEFVLATGTVELGFDAPAPRNLKVGFTWDGGQTPVSTIAAGETFALEYERMVETGLLEQPVTVHALAGTGYTRAHVEASAGLLSIRLE